jgi:hypothetical protein
MGLIAEKTAQTAADWSRAAGYFAQFAALEPTDVGYLLLAALSTTPGARRTLTGPTGRPCNFRPTWPNRGSGQPSCRRSRASNSVETRQFCTRVRHLALIFRDLGSALRAC